MSDHHPHERPEHERPLPSAHRTPAQRVRDAYDQEAAVPPPNYEAGSQFASIIHRQVAAARRAAGEPEAAPLPAAMPAHLRHGPGSQTAAAFYRQAEQQRAREAVGEAEPMPPEMLQPTHQEPPASDTRDGALDLDRGQIINGVATPGEAPAGQEHNPNHHQPPHHQNPNHHQPPPHKSPPPGYVPPSPPYQPPIGSTPILGGTTVSLAAPTPEQVFAQVQPLICIPHPPKENFDHAAFCMSPLNPAGQEKVLMDLATKQFGADKAESIVEGLYATAVIPIMVHVPDEALRRIKNVVKGYKWAPPGDEPEWAYVGNEAHRQIARNYVLTHPGDNVRVNQISIATIAKLLGGDVEHTYIDKGFLGWEPDILNVTRRQLYEIKSWRQEEEARIKRDNYIAIFAALGVEIEPGPSADIGVNGVVAGPDGYYMFMSPEPGIVIYQKRNGDYNPVPVPAQQTEQQPDSNQDFIARMQAITGLSGVALALYLLISEGSRLFPPRDLLPIP